MTASCHLPFQGRQDSISAAWLPLKGELSLKATERPKYAKHTFLYSHQINLYQPVKKYVGLPLQRTHTVKAGTSSVMASPCHLPQRGRLIDTFESAFICTLVFAKFAHTPMSLPLWGRWLPAGQTDEVFLRVHRYAGFDESSPSEPLFASYT